MAANNAPTLTCHTYPTAASNLRKRRLWNASQSQDVTRSTVYNFNKCLISYTPIDTPAGAQRKQGGFHRLGLHQLSSATVDTNAGKRQNKLLSQDGELTSRLLWCVKFKSLDQNLRRRYGPYTYATVLSHNLQGEKSRPAHMWQRQSVVNKT